MAKKTTVTICYLCEDGLDKQEMIITNLIPNDLLPEHMADTYRNTSGYFKNNFMCHLGNYKEQYVTFSSIDIANLESVDNKTFKFLSKEEFLKYVIEKRREYKNSLQCDTSISSASTPDTLRRS